MKHILAKYLVFIVALFISFNGFANTKTITTPTFTINVPVNMELIQHTREAFDGTSSYEYDYIFNVPSKEGNSTEEIAITTLPVSKISLLTKGKDSLITSDTLFSLGAYVDSNHLEQKISKEMMNQKPQLFQLNNLTFSMALISSDDATDAAFLTTIANNATYLIALFSMNNDPVIRKKQMDEMMSSVATIQFLGLPENR